MYRLLGTRLFPQRPGQCSRFLECLTRSKSQRHRCARNPIFGRIERNERERQSEGDVKTEPKLLHLALATNRTVLMIHHSVKATLFMVNNSYGTFSLTVSKSPVCIFKLPPTESSGAGSTRKPSPPLRPRAANKRRGVRAPVSSSKSARRGDFVPPPSPPPTDNISCERGGFAIGSKE